MTRFFCHFMLWTASAAFRIPLRLPEEQAAEAAFQDGQLR